MTQGAQRGLCRAVLRSSSGNARHSPRTQRASGALRAGLGHVFAGEAAEWIRHRKQLPGSRKSVRFGQTHALSGTVAGWAPNEKNPTWAGTGRQPVYA